MGISFDYYKIFYNVAKYGKISVAAEKLFISQPAITQTVKKLEEQLGVKLFFRNKYGVELTYEGKAFYEYLKHSIENLENAESYLSNFNDLEKGQIKIAGGINFIEYFIMPTVDKFVEEYPNINISIRTVNRKERITQLINGEVDISLLDLAEDENNVPNVEITKLHESDKYLFIASKKYLEEHNFKSFEELVNPTVIIPYSKNVERVFKEFSKKNDFKYSTKYEVDVSSRLFEMVYAGKGIGFTGKMYFDYNPFNADDFVVIKEVTSIPSYIYLATLKKELCNKATLEFVKRVKERHNLI